MAKYKKKCIKKCHVKIIVKDQRKNILYNNQNMIPLTPVNPYNPLYLFVNNGSSNQISNIQNGNLVNTGGSVGAWAYEYVPGVDPNPFFR